MRNSGFISFTGSFFFILIFIFFAVPATSETYSGHVIEERAIVSPETGRSKIKPYKVILDVDSAKDLEQVFTEPGLTWANCTKQINDVTKQEYCQESVGFLKKDSEIEVLGISPISGIETDMNGNKISVPYVKVRFKNPNKDVKSKTSKFIEGYVKSTRLRKRNGDEILPPIFSAPTKVEKLKDSPEPVSESTNADWCEPEKPMDSSVVSGYNKLSNQFSKEYHKTIDEITELIVNKIGGCIDKRKANLTIPMIQQEINFKISVMFSDSKLNGKLKKLNVSAEKLRQIDVLSRTSFGEVAACYSNSTDEIPAAFSLLALNRQKAIAENSPRYRPRFITGEHDKRFSDFEKLLMSPSQFNVWTDPNNSSHSLCPPSRPDDTWNVGHKSKEDVKKPNPQDSLNWEKSVRMAVETVMYGDSLRQRADPAGKFDYKDFTSYRDKYYTAERAYPVLFGRKFPKLPKFKIVTEEVVPIHARGKKGKELKPAKKVYRKKKIMLDGTSWVPENCMQIWTEPPDAEPSDKVKAKKTKLSQDQKGSISKPRKPAKN